MKTNSVNVLFKASLKSIVPSNKLGIKLTDKLRFKAHLQN